MEFNLLKKNIHIDFKITVFLLILFSFLMYISIIYSNNELVSTNCPTILSILSGIITAIIFVHYTYIRNQEFENRRYFSLLYEEILDNIKKFDDFKSYLDISYDDWKQRNNHGFKKWINPKLINLNPKYEFFYIFLPSNNFQTLINRGLHVDIKGYNKVYSDSAWHLLNLFYYNTQDFSRKVQIIENLAVTAMEKSKETFIDTHKKYDFLFYSAINGIIDIEKQEPEKHLPRIRINNIPFLFSLPSGFYIEASYSELIDKCNHDILELYEQIKKMNQINWFIEKPKDFDDFIDKILQQNDKNQLFSFFKQKK